MEFGFEHLRIFLFNYGSVTVAQAGFFVSVTVVFYRLFCLPISQILRTIKTLAKPLASLIKVEAPKYATLSKVCVETGQLSHYVYTRLNVLASGLKFVGVRPLETSEALSRGVDVISEASLLVFAAGVMIIEAIFL